MRIALCISGQMRLFERGAVSLREKLIKNHQCDIFIHTWKNRGLSSIAQRNYPIGVHKYIVDTFDSDKWVDANHKLQKFPSLLSAMNADECITTQLLAESYGDAHVVVEDIPQDYEETQTLFGVSYPDLLKKLNPRHFHNLAMFYKIWACNQLRIQHQNKNNIEYDYVIRARPDLILLNEIDLYTCKKDRINQLNGEKSKYVFDQFAISSPELMDVYSSVWNELRDYWDLSKHADIPIEERTIGRLLYHHITKKGAKSAAIENFGYELDGGNMTAQNVLNMIKSDVVDNRTETRDAIILSNYICFCEEHYNNATGKQFQKERKELGKIGIDCQILTKYKSVIASKNDEKIISTGLRILSTIKSSAYVVNNMLNSYLRTNKISEAISLIDGTEFNDIRKAGFYIKLINEKFLNSLSESEFRSIIKKLDIIAIKSPDAALKVASAYLFFGDTGNAAKYCLICLRLNNIKSNKIKKIPSENIINTWQEITRVIGVNKRHLKILLQ